MIFDYFESVSKKGQVCTKDLFFQKTHDESLIPLFNQIARATSKDEQQRLKKKLPGFTWQAHFPKGMRRNAEAEPSGLYMIDVDGVERPFQVWEKLVSRCDELGILLAHMTPSKHGLRVICRMDKCPQMSIADCQEWFAEQTGLDIDTACKDLARFSYLVPNEYIYYLDNNIWREEASTTKKIVASTVNGQLLETSKSSHQTEVGASTSGNDFNSTSKNTKDTKNILVSTVNGLQSTEVDKEISCSFVPFVVNKKESSVVNKTQDSYRGIPLSDIAHKWLELNGGEPQQGERNTVLFELATRMRYITEFSPKVIASVIPHCGLPEEEVLALCKSACTTQRSTKMPSDLKMVIKNLSAVNGQQSTEDTPNSSPFTPNSSLLTPNSESYDPHDEEFLLRLPKLPLGLRESLLGKPEKVKFPIIAGIMPLAMAYASDVRVRYCDGKIHRLNGMSIIVGNQASGKSAVADVIKVWKRPMAQADAEQRRLEDEYKAFKKKRKQSERLPDEPQGPILNVPITISCSTLLKRMKRARNRHLYSFGEELDTLRKTNGAGSWSSKYDVYRMGFDNGEWGQDYNSDNAESGVVNVAYNWTILGTRGAVDKCFKSDSVENGMSGRVLFARLPESNYEHLVVYSDESIDNDNDLENISDELLSPNQQRMIEAAHLLSNCSGYYDTPRLRKTIANWVNQKADEAREKQDKVLDTFRKRAAVIGFRCGVIYQLLENGANESDIVKAESDIVSETTSSGESRHRESKNSLEFATLLADYTLKYQMELFGEQLLQVQSVVASETGYQSRNKRLFDELPKEFCFELLKTLRPDAHISALREMIYYWKRKSLITIVGNNMWKKNS